MKSILNGPQLQDLLTDLRRKDYELKRQESEGRLNGYTVRNEKSEETLLTLLEENAEESLANRRKNIVNSFFFRRYTFADALASGITAGLRGRSQRRLQSDTFGEPFPGDP